VAGGVLHGLARVCEAAARYKAHGKEALALMESAADATDNMLEWLQYLTPAEAETVRERMKDLERALRAAQGKLLACFSGGARGQAQLLIAVFGGKDATFDSLEDRLERASSLFRRTAETAKLRRDNEAAEARGGAMVAATAAVEMAADMELNFDWVFTDKLGDYFEGSRQWLFEAFDEWLAAERDAEVAFTDQGAGKAPKLRVVGAMLWVVGGAGSGKTAWSGKLCSDRGGAVAARHFCRHADINLNDPRRMIRSLAAQLVEAGLMDAADAASGGGGGGGETLKELFDALIAVPLKRTSPPADGQRRVILIDALDECASGGKNALLELIAGSFGDGALPEWLRLVVTSRPEHDIETKLAHFAPVQREGDGNKEDARAYLAHLLQGKVAVADEPAALRLLEERSQSLFLYLSFVRSRLAEVDQPRLATLEELRHFPDGLTGIYEGEFKRVFKSKSTQAWHRAKPLLEMLVAAREPLPVQAAAAALALDRPDCELVVLRGAVSLLFPVREGRFVPFHKTATDWLGRAEESAGFFVAAAEGHTRLLRAAAAEAAAGRLDGQLMLAAAARDSLGGAARAEGAGRGSDAAAAYLLQHATAHAVAVAAPAPARSSRPLSTGSFR
jgi:hypothetical protein